MTNTNTTTEPPERGNEPFQLSDAEVTGIADAVGVRADVVRSIRGGDYAEVRANAAKLADMAPSARSTPPSEIPKHQPSKIGVESGEVPPKAVADAIRRRLGMP